MAGTTYVSGGGNGGYYRVKANAELQAAQLRQQGFNVGVYKNVTYSGMTADGHSVQRPMPVWQVNYSTSGAGSGGGGWPSPGGGQQLTGPVAAQLGLPGYAGPSPFKFRAGASNVQSFKPPRMGDFLGLDTFNPETKISPEYTPDEVNVDDLTVIGSRCNRRGTAKLNEDIKSVRTHAFATASATAIANAALTADSDFFTFTLEPGGTPETHAFWLDTTGSDTEPAGSQSADNSYRVVTTGLTAAQVATAIRNRFNSVRIGEILASIVTGTPTVVSFTTYGDELDWLLEESVTDAGFTVVDFADTAAAALHANYDGLSLCRVPATEDQPDQLILAFKDSNREIGGSTVGVQPVSLHLVTAHPTSGRPFDLDNMPGPSIALSQQAGPRIRVDSDYEAVFPDQVGLVQDTVKGILARYSQTAYPEDPFGHDADDGSIAFPNIASNPTWAGESRPDLSDIVTAGVWFVSVWAVGVRGITRAARARIVVT